RGVVDHASRLSGPRGGEREDEVAVTEPGDTRVVSRRDDGVQVVRRPRGDEGWHLAGRVDDEVRADLLVPDALEVARDERRLVQRAASVHEFAVLVRDAGVQAERD